MRRQKGYGGRVRSLTGVVLTSVMLAFSPTTAAHGTARATIPVACTTGDLITAMSGAVSGDVLELTDYCVYDITTLFSGEDGLPPITVPLTITGNNATLLRDTAATDEFRLLDVDSGGQLDVTDLTVTNGFVSAGTGSGGGILVTGTGTLSGTNLTVQGNATSLLGGGIHVAPSGSATLTDSLVKDNRSFTGAGINCYGVLVLDGTTVSGNRAQNVGGGVTVSATATSTTLTNSTIQNNVSALQGGGLYATSGTVTATGTTIKNNVSTVGGGVRARFSGTKTFTNSTISGNTAKGTSPQGGGISSESPMVLNNTDVTGNKTVGAGGQGAGIWTDINTLDIGSTSTVSGNLASGQYSQGGALYSAGGTITIDSSALTANKATGTGSVSGGIYNSGGTYTINNSTITGNSSPTAPAPGGVYTTVAINPTGTTITGNTPTNCLLSPAAVTPCTN